MSRNTSSSAPSRVVVRGQLDRIAGVADVDEFVPLTTRPASTSRQGITRLICTHSP